MGEAYLTRGGGSGGAELDALESTVNNHIANTVIHPRIAYGRYGTASSGKATSVNLGFRPKVVFVSGETKITNDGIHKYLSDSRDARTYLNMALAIDGYPGYGCSASTTGNIETSSITITDTGFSISAGYNKPGLATKAGSYFAIG